MIVLLVDDDRLGRVMLAENLRSQGLEIVEAESGAEAMSVWQTDRFDAVVSDILMPVMDGLELAANIRADEARNNATRPCRLFALTASVTSRDDENRVGQLFDTVLSKPISSQALLRALRND